MKTTEEYLKLWGLQNAFSGVSPEEITLRTYQDGEPLFLAGQDVDAVYLLVEGRCRLYGLSREGKEVLVNYKEAVGLFGDMEILLGLEFKLSMAAIGHAVVLKISKRAMEKKLMYHIDFLRFLTKEMAEKMYIDSAHQIQSILKDGKARVARLLWRQVQAENKECFSFSCRKTARDAGISERQLTRVLGEWEEEEIIRREGRKIRVLNFQALEALKSDE